MEKKNQQAQDINSIEEINNNPEPVIEITPILYVFSYLNLERQ
jgi:hypothetical protein